MAGSPVGGELLLVVTADASTHCSKSDALLLLGLSGWRNEPMELVFGFEVPVPHGPDVFEVVGAKIGLARPLLHLTNVCRRSANLLDSQWSELLVTGHGPPQVVAVANIAGHDATGRVVEAGKGHAVQRAGASARTALTSQHVSLGRDIESVDAEPLMGPRRMGVAEREGRKDSHAPSR
jgi:hypothetical protein